MEHIITIRIEECQMKNLGKSNFILKSTLVIFFIFTAINVIVSMFTNTKTVSPGSDTTISLTNDWEYRLGDSPIGRNNTPSWAYETAASQWKSYAFPGKPPNNTDTDTVWVRTKLPDIQMEEPHLFFRTADSFFEVYIDGKLVSNYGQIGDRFKVAGSPWRIIPLPKNFAGKMLTFRMYSANSDSLGIVSRPAIDSAKNLMIHLVKRDLGTVILAFLYVFTGCATILIFVFGELRKLPFFALGLSSIFMGGWLFAETQISLLLVDSASFWAYIGFISGYLMPAGFCFFIKEIFDNRVKLVLVFLWRLHILYLLITLILDTLHIVPMILTLDPYILLLAITMTASVSSVAISAIKGHAHAKLLLAGLSMLVLTGICEIFGWHLKILPWTYHASKWGMLFFLTSIVLVIGRLYNEFQKKLLEYSEELDYKQKLLAAAEEYDNLKNEFFSNISHEFRTPINIIITSLNLIELYEKKNANASGELGANTKLSRNIRIIRQNCFRLMRLVNNLIDITRIDSGYLDPSFIEGDIVETVREIAFSIHEFVKSKDLHFEFVCNIDHKVICFDPDMIERILLNLVSNAVKFSNAGGTISIGLHEEQDRILITVKDTGIGIPEDKLNIIFERFRQAHRVQHKNHEGSGIGLSLVRSLVRMHQGDIWVKSEVGKGSEFTFSLPSVTSPGHSIFPDYRKAVLQSHTEKINIELSDIPS